MPPRTVKKTAGPGTKRAAKARATPKAKAAPEEKPEVQVEVKEETKAVEVVEEKIIDDKAEVNLEPKDVSKSEGLEAKDGSKKEEKLEENPTVAEPEEKLDLKSKYCIRIWIGLCGLPVDFKIWKNKKHTYVYIYISYYTRIGGRYLVFINKHIIWYLVKL